ncbi:MAG: hypothetical protein U9O98_08430 [Asgard group archaeon]|nr:hypothetical protein [Asgard group archaeon]
MDPFVLTIIIIFATGITISVLRTTVKDPCLKDFRKDSSIVLMKNEKPVFGKLELKSSGLILHYHEPYESGDHYESSFIIYKSEFAAIKNVIRIVNDLDENESRRRNIRSLLIKRSFFSSIRRFLRNVFALLRDSLVDTFRLFVGRTSPKSSILSSGGTYINKVGESFVDYVGNAYDPILEKLIGREIVVEISENGQWKEFTGVLRNYSKDFLEVLSIEMPVTLEIPAAKSILEKFEVSVEISENDSGIIKNKRNSGLKIDVDGSVEVVESGKSFEIDKFSSVKTISLVIKEEMDVIFPRSDAIVRHNTPEASK